MLTFRCSSALLKRIAARSRPHGQPAQLVQHVFGRAVPAGRTLYLVGQIPLERGRPGRGGLPVDLVQPRVRDSGIHQGQRGPQFVSHVGVRAALDFPTIPAGQLLQLLLGLYQLPCRVFCRFVLLVVKGDHKISGTARRGVVPGGHHTAPVALRLAHHAHIIAAPRARHPQNQGKVLGALQRRAHPRASA